MSENLVIREHNEENGHYNADIDTEYVKRLRSLNLTDEQIAGVLVVNSTTCNHCWDAPSGCHCWNDE